MVARAPKGPTSATDRLVLASKGPKSAKTAMESLIKVGVRISKAKRKKLACSEARRRLLDLVRGVMISADTRDPASNTSTETFSTCLIRHQTTTFVVFS